MANSPGRAFDPQALGRAYDVPPSACSARTRELLAAGVDDAALDLGCGPGHLTTELAATARVVVLQVLEYVPDVVRALLELHRVLRPAGRAVLVATLAEATERGEVCAGDPAADARRTYNLLGGLLYLVLWSGRHEDAVAVKRSVLSFLHRAFGVAEPGR